MKMAIISIKRLRGFVGQWGLCQKMKIKWNIKVLCNKMKLSNISIKCWKIVTMTQLEDVYDKNSHTYYATGKWFFYTNIMKA